MLWLVGIINRIKRNNYVTAVVIIGGLVLTIMQGPAEIKKTIVEFLGVFGYSPAEVAEEKRVKLNSFQLGTALGDVLWLRYVREKTGVELPSDLQTDYDSKTEQVRSRVAALGLQTDPMKLDYISLIGPLEFGTTPGYHSLEQLLRQEKGSGPAAAFSAGLKSRAYFWKASQLDFEVFGISYERDIEGAMDAVKYGLPAFKCPQLSDDPRSNKIDVQMAILDWRHDVEEALMP